jgi:hypothetical protein
VPVATISADGKSAWTVEPDPPVRRTVLVERDGKSWRVLMAHASRGVEADVARHNEEKGSWPPLADVGEGVPERRRSWRRSSATRWAAPTPSPR